MEEYDLYHFGPPYQVYPDEGDFFDRGFQILKCSCV